MCRSLHSFRQWPLRRIWRIAGRHRYYAHRRAGRCLFLGATSPFYCSCARPMDHIRHLCFSIRPVRLADAQTPQGGNPCKRGSVTGVVIAARPEGSARLSLTMHELATNSVKYGALSRSVGEVNVTTTIENGTLVLAWHETGGPIVDPKPVRRGFGETSGQFILPRASVRLVSEPSSGRQVSWPMANGYRGRSDPDGWLSPRSYHRGTEVPKREPPV